MRIALGAFIYCHLALHLLPGRGTIENQGASLPKFPY